MPTPGALAHADFKVPGRIELGEQPRAQRGRKIQSKYHTMQQTGRAAGQSRDDTIGCSAGEHRSASWRHPLFVRWLRDA